MLVHKTNMHPFRPEGLPVWLLKNQVYFIKFKKWYFSNFLAKNMHGNWPTFRPGDMSNRERRDPSVNMGVQ